MKMLCTHMGAWKAWDDVRKYLMGSEVYMETSFSFQWLGMAETVRLIRDHGVEKLGELLASLNAARGRLAVVERVDPAVQQLTGMLRKLTGAMGELTTLKTGAANPLIGMLKDADWSAQCWALGCRRVPSPSR